MTIETNNLTVHRLGRPVLRGVSVRIESGECVSIIGPNGAGKSTLMAALLGLLPAGDGEVILDGRPIHSMRRREIARRIAYVPQVHEGYTGFRVSDVVESGRYVHLDALEPLGEADRRAVDEALASCRITHLSGRMVHTLSGGERQKVWIAAALAQQTPVLFLDEPTTALDPAHQAELIRIMRAFATGDHTLLVICHDLNLALALGGRTLAIRDGQVVFNEPAEVLQDTGRLAELFGTEFVLCRDAAGSNPCVHLRV